ncbi:hypothetical protein PACTADRAFT_50069 [Pachysolen tannophilus NRRL Y-2460]|uniref:DUF3533 domain-containing protein n=1 Tax=Pachysolen tannophilus NRRL Y-2460 TaxID=669874 RepID=A0A1E4TU89_PACTA|nr:hypothetical protein PACTADRAFT_50069 [Pachysolen tannophilus NRRL Y-2460]
MSDFHSSGNNESSSIVPDRAESASNDSVSTLSSIAEAPVVYRAETDNAADNEAENEERRRKQLEPEPFPLDESDYDGSDLASLASSVDSYFNSNIDADLMGNRHLSVSLANRTRGETIDGIAEQESNLQRQPSYLKRSRSSVVNTIKRTATYTAIQKLGFFDDEFRNERLQVFLAFLKNYVLLCVVFAMALSIYWGSYYGRNTRYKNMKMLVVIDDQEVNGVEPLVGMAVEETAELAAVKYYGDWKVFNSTEFSEIASKHDNTIEQEVYRQIHHQLYWAAIYVKENSTNRLYEAIVNLNNSFSSSETLIEVVYESGRDPMAISSYVSSFTVIFENAFLQVAPSSLYKPLIENYLNESQVEDLISNNLTNLITDPPTFKVVDNLPIKNTVIFAPLQLGLVYLVVFAFFQFLLSLRIHSFIAEKVQGRKYIIYRILASQFAYVILSLSYVVLNCAFNLDYASAFGRSGFLVLWCVSYLTMSSLGSVNEVVALLCFAFLPPAIGLWLVFFMVLNIAPTFSPIVLCPNFYRYGYAFPIHNSYEAAKVVFNNSYKGQFGRNIGILIAWIVVFNSIMPFVMIYVTKVQRLKSTVTTEQPSK